MIGLVRYDYTCHESRPSMEHCAPARPDYPAWRRTASEEVVNAVTHGFGFVIAAAGSLVMMSGVLALGNTELVIGFGSYLTSLLAVYAMSTLSHSTTSVRWKSSSGSSIKRSFTC